MASKTTNYEFHKIDLTDAPPDITVLNPNWDKIDEHLHNTVPNTRKVNGKALNTDIELTASDVDALPIEGGTLNGALTVIDNFNVNKVFDDVEYKTYVRPINYSIASNGEYSTALMHYKGETSNAQLMFNKDGIMLRDNVNAKAYKIYGQYNATTMRSESLNRTTAVNAADTNYTTLMARGSSLHTADTNPSVNGAICWTYK